MGPSNKPEKVKYLFSWWMAALLIVGVGLNIGLSRLMVTLKAPLFFDALGTAIASVISGPIGGMLTALITQSVDMSFDLTSIYYSLAFIVFAAIISHTVRMGLFKKIWGLPLIILTSSLLLSLFQSLIFFLLSEGKIDYSFVGGLADSFAKQGLPSFWALWFADFLYQLLDKTIALILVYILVRFLPDKILSHYLQGGFFYKKEPIKTSKKKIRWRSIQGKATVLVSFVSIAVVVIVSAVSATIYRGRCISDYSELGQDYSQAMCEIISGDDVDSFLVAGQKDSEYAQTEKRLYGLFNSCDKIEYMYVYKIEEDGCHVVFDLDTADVKGAERGDIIPFDEGFAPYLSALKAGEKINPIISSDQYGWLCSVYTPIYDSNNKTVAYACTDIDMHNITADINSFLMKLLGLVFSFIILYLCLTYYFIDNLLIQPINTLAKRTRDYKAVGIENWSLSPVRDQQGEISTNDELEELFVSLKESEDAASEDYRTIEEQTAKMLRMERNIVLAMADMVELRDKNTGEHIKRTSFYVELIANQLYKEKAFPEILTDDYRKNVILAAPLHDVGKIKISDVVLNKPGKLTDEEFALMKTHTSEGKKIIDMALEGITGNTYLEVARDMAAYHHEKWDGSGYMEGLKGEQIPLSARIMAVADVFDALVSKRSYKEPFPYPTALDIIKKESGTHFDPRIVEAFLEVQEDVKKELNSKE